MEKQKKETNKQLNSAVINTNVPLETYNRIVWLTGSRLTGVNKKFSHEEVQHITSIWNWKQMLKKDKITLMFP